MPGHIRLLSKVGLAYAYMIDNAYVAAFQKQMELVLTAVISANANRIFSDGEYD